MRRMHRRTMVQVSVGALLAALTRDLDAARQVDEVLPFDDLTDFKPDIRLANPRVRAFDLRKLTSAVTPESDFFSFHQTEVEKIDPSRWRLTIGGLVDNPGSLTLDEVMSRPDRRELTVTIECSGNAPGPAANGLVSTGVWTGVGLASLLRERGLKPEAREVVFLGADFELDRETQFGTPHGRSVFVQDALQPDALLAFAMNGRPLTPEHGFPLRVILPGWYGMTHIKWLERIEVLDRRYEGTHMARNYHSVVALEDAAGELWIETGITRVRLKSVVARVTRKRTEGRWATTIAGAAWSGGAPVNGVEVRVDDGAWRPATLSKPAGPHAWTLWSIDWPDAAPGLHQIVSRARGADGRIQPATDELREKMKTTRENHAQWPRRVRVPRDVP